MYVCGGRKRKGHKDESETELALQQHTVYWKRPGDSQVMPRQAAVPSEMHWRGRILHNPALPLLMHFCLSGYNALSLEGTPAVFARPAAIFLFW